MLQQLEAGMAALAADLQAETAALAAGGWEASYKDAARFTATDALQPFFATVARVHPLVLDLWALQAGLPVSADWLCNLSKGYAVAVAHLYYSTLVQYVSPVVQRDLMPPQAEAWKQYLQTNAQMARALCIPIFLHRNTDHRRDIPNKKGIKGGDHLLAIALTNKGVCMWRWHAIIQAQRTLGVPSRTEPRLHISRPNPVNAHSLFFCFLSGYR
jgi:hypothetical protein